MSLEEIMAKSKAEYEALSPGEKERLKAEDEAGSLAAREALKHFVAAQVNRKEEAVRDNPRGEGDDITPWLDFNRGGLPCMTIICRQVDRDDSLWAVQVGASALAADELWLVHDSHLAKNPINPATGKEWAKGEMQKGCEESGFCDLGLITDCLVFLHYDRATGCLDMGNLPYHAHHRDSAPYGEVVWVKDEETYTRFRPDRPGGGLRGLVPDTIRDAFALPIFDPMESLAEIEEIIGVKVGAEDFGFTDHQARVHADCAIAKFIMEKGRYLAAVPCTTEEDAEIVRRSFEGMEGMDVEEIRVG